MIFGVAFYSFTIGNLASIIASIDVKAAHLKEKLNLLSEYSRKVNLPPSVENRIKKFLENNHAELLHQYDQNNLLDALPSNLRSQVVSHTHGEIVRKLRFFDDKS